MSGDEAAAGPTTCYNEVFLNNRWIRVDNVINPGPFVGDKLFVKVYSLASWNDRTDWRTPRPPEEGWNENRDFRTLEVSDAYPKHPSPAATAIDMAVDDASLSVSRQSRWELLHDNHSSATKAGAESSVRRHFYAGDPEKNGRLLATHASGPIMPGGTWGEGASQARLIAGRGHDCRRHRPRQRGEGAGRVEQQSPARAPGPQGLPVSGDDAGPATSGGDGGGGPGPNDL